MFQTLYLDYLFFTGYLFLFAWLITRIKLFNQSGLSNTQLIILFLLKIITGIFYGWVGIYYGYFAYMYDTWGYHNFSIKEYQLLFTDPGEYLTNLFISHYESGYGRFFASTDSYWNDLKMNIFIKLLSVFNIFSRGNYYINVVFYSFFTLMGPVLIYRVMMDIFPEKKIPVLLATFLIPSFLYWSSGIHKDGMVVTALGVIAYHFYFGLKNKKLNLKRWAYIILGALILLAMRNYVLIILTPALVAWYISAKRQRKMLGIFAATYIVAAILFFTLRYISPSLDLPKAVADKQKAFMQLEGGSGIEVNELKPQFTSFIQNAPQAIVNAMLRPFPSDVKHILSMGVAVETAFLFFLFLLFVFLRDKSNNQGRPFLFFCFFLSISLLITIGYTVNFLGAIVRYRSIIIPFLIVPIAARIDWKRIKDLIFNNIK